MTLWRDFVAGTCGKGTGLLLAVGALVLSLATIPLIFRPLVELVSRLDPERMRKARVRRISFSLLLTSFTLTIFTYLHAILPASVRHDHLHYELAELFFILFGLYAVFEILLAFFAHFLPQSRGGTPVSPIYKDLFRTIVFFGVLLFALKQAFPAANLTALLTTSAILSVVLGLALQESLANIFSGVVLSVDRPYQPGDWILVDGIEGKVMDSNWRSTRLLNRDNDMLHVPNSIMARSNFINFAQPSGLHLCRRNLSVELAAQPNKVRSVLIDMMMRADGVVRDPAPDVFTLSFGEMGATYELRFWIRDFDRRTRIESDVIRGAWYHLHRNRIRLAYPSHDLYSRRDRPDSAREEVVSLLRRVDILKALDADDVTLLADDLRSQLFAHDEVVCRQGEMGSTFYIIRSGRVAVRTKSAEGIESEVARLGPGDYFGEVSLLTGEARSSTCVAVEDTELLALDRETFSVLLQENPPVAQRMSEVLAMRTQAAQAKIQQDRETMARPSQKADEAATRRILEKIWNIFGFQK